MSPNGEYVAVASGAWTGTHAAGFLNKRLFAIWRGNIYEVFESSFKMIASGGYSDAKFIVQHGDYLYTVLEGRLNRVTITGDTATKERVGLLDLDDTPTMVSTGGYLYCTAEGKWMWIIPTNGLGQLLPGEGNVTAAVAYKGAIYAINQDGNLDTVNPEHGQTVHTYDYEGLFKGSRAIVEHLNLLYAIGNDNRFYKINPLTGIVLAKGTGTNWKTDVPMAAANW